MCTSIKCRQHKELVYVYSSFVPISYHVYCSTVCLFPLKKMSRTVTSTYNIVVMSMGSELKLEFLFDTNQLAV